MSCSAITIVGDGLAGLMLALQLRESGLSVEVLGDGQSNAPPLALVHLFAGRTFRRSRLELRAFEAAIVHWRAEPLAAEFPVRRRLAPGDRLDRSADGAGLPPHFAPRRLDPEWVTYQPGFSIATQALQTRLLADLKPCYRRRRVDVSEMSGPRVLALGVDAAEHWPQWKWDRSAGRTVEATPEVGEAIVHIGGGVHVVPHPNGGNVVVGGRFSPLQPNRADELEKAHELTGQQYRPVETWSGRRCAPAADRLPVMGWMDEETFAFCGFGSRALFWLPYCVNLACGALVSGESIPEELRWQRLGALESEPPIVRNPLRQLSDDAGAPPRTESLDRRDR